MATRKTRITIADSLLNRARGILRTATPRETVEEALLLVLRARARRDEIEALRSMRGMDLDDDRVMAKAWRA